MSALPPRADIQTDVAERVSAVDEATKLLRQGREELLSQQVNDLADLIYVLTTNEAAA